MFTPDQYQLIDFGKGRKLERFGKYVVDRPCPAAEGVARSTPANWKSAHARYQRDSGQDGRWLPPAALPRTWTISCDTLVFQLRATPFGHVGVFVEQAANWSWIARQVRRADRPIKVLNLFAYTGGSTLAAASAGAEVVHVDAARNVVQWARRNAQLSGMADKPIRWICEDAMKFVHRERKRGRFYDAVILDPPSYGHGPKGEIWKLSSGLRPLLDACRMLTEPRRAFLLLTCHSPDFGPAELQASLADTVFGHCQGGVTGTPLAVQAADGRRLACGTLARWPA